MAESQAPPSLPSPLADAEVLIHWLQQSFSILTKAAEADNLNESSASIDALVQFLDAVSSSAISDPPDNAALSKAVAVLSQIQNYICSSSSMSQETIDALSFELPKAIAKFAGLSQQCSEMVESVVDQFTERCSAREMITIFCDALSLYGDTTDAPGYISPLLHGLSKVFISIRRRHFEVLKTAVSGILNSMKVASFDDRYDSRDMFQKSIILANSIKATCETLEGRVREQIRALLGVYVLQTMILVSIGMNNEESICLDIVSQLLQFFPYCGFSFIDCLTGHVIDRTSALLVENDSDDYMNVFSYVEHGAVLSVIWGHLSDRAAQAAGQDISKLKDEIRSMEMERWEAVGMLKHIFTMEELPWSLKAHAMEFLLIITSNFNHPQVDESIIYTIQIPCLLNTLKAILMVMMCAPDAAVRKNAWMALRQVLSEIPGSFRLDVFKNLVEYSSASSAIALLLDCVKEFLRSEYTAEEEETSSLFWCPGVLELVEVVLKPPNNLPPSLPEQCDSVNAALNLYRYVLVMESTGNTNYTGVLSKSNLEKAYKKWFLPLRTLVTGISADNRNCSHQIADDILAGLNPIEMVLYRNIELVEDKLKQI